MFFAKHDHMPPEIPKRGFCHFEAIENTREFAVESLFCDISTSIKWIKRMRETIVKRGQSRNLSRNPLF